MPASVTILEHSRHPSSSDLRAKTRDARAPVRAAAARAMGRIQSWEYLSDLIRLLRDPELPVVTEAVFAIGQLGWVDPPAADAAIEALRALLPLEKHSHLPIRCAAVEALGKLGSKKPELVLETLLRGLKDPEALLRRQASLALFRMHSSTKERPKNVVNAWIDAAADADDEVRWRAVYPFSRFKEPGAISALMQTAKDPSIWVRLFSVRALGKTEDAGVADALLDAAKDVDPRVRYEAVLALGAVKQHRLVPKELLQDPAFQVRSAATAMLGQAKLFDEKQFRLLIDDPSTTVRCAAISAYALAFKDRRLPEDLRGLASDPDWRLRAQVVQSAGIEDLELLRQARGDSDERVQASALSAIGKIDNDDAWALVIAALSSDKLSVRATAVEIAAERKKPQTAGALVACYENSLSREWIEVRESIIDSIAPLPRTPEITAFFQKVLGSDPAPSVRTKSAQALGLVRPVPPSKIEREDLLSMNVPATTNVVLETDKGEIELQLFPEEAPVHVANFVQLVEKGHYDGLTFHRLVPNFVIQGGDPRGDGWGDAGYNIRDEINPLPYDRGTLGMPKAGKDTGGCQLFITHIPTPHLDGRYTVFGKVVRGMDVVDQVEIGTKFLRAKTVSR
jgi:cyclophilin family peptidyl-prolyl cis-trans isomerase/HEAT repeat protein